MIVKVALPVPPSYVLDYSVDCQNVELFERVLVQVGKRQLIGFIVAKDVKIGYEAEKLKTIIRTLDKPISLAIQKLILWLSQYYCCDIYSAIRLALPNDFLKLQEVKPQQDTYVYIDKVRLQQHKLTAKQQDLISAIAAQELIKLEELKQLASSYVINKLFANNILNKTYKLKQSENVLNTDKSRVLNQQQQYVLEQILANTNFNVSLLYGITGSGKTEIYLQAIAEVLAKSRQVLILVPEINLTPQTIKRFENRFVDKNVVALHSKLSDKARLTNWLKIKQGKADIVIATRSGVLADFCNLGMIIVDEEHDGSFKQQTTTIRYNARDVAVFRARQLDIPIVLGSATPSLQSYYNCVSGKYHLLKLTQRALNSHKNQIELLDLKSAIVDNGISSQLFALLQKNIQAHQQSLVFINKLGFAKALVCKSCGEVVECKKCDKPYTLHTQPYQYLECHFCGSRKPLVTACPSCGAQELFPYGCGTEKIQARIEAKFPYNRVVRFDRANIKTITDLHAVNQLINDNQVDVIVGTQMIAKGHHFENITLVGLINIDAGLYSSDFNAIEKTAQMIVQVAGRAGRADKPGTIVLQTYQPENKLLQLLVNNDYLEFLDYLLQQRKYAGYPPYAYQAQIIAESKRQGQVLELLNDVYSSISSSVNIQVSKPLPALHLKRNNVYRYSLLLTAKTRKEINSVVKQINNKFVINIPSTVKMCFDIDPIELA
ncbi:primosomal protein N' [Francisella tularensis subsp. novicida]|uniref:Replication restart protein PriA n=2 Tax=Francisella tularensis TaxID=263 RepID=A0A6I4RXJ6_FRATU|nr:primosomal protein N' [Francisella tularensis]ABK89099.1 primosomal protein N [Francisella tularensis subsp. novicida U112]AJI61306.1 primosomal protein N' [Francisella tularensis subsp. novicida U112]EDX18837.1 primosomal protein N' [Francisella tularensis subsp. novicida FTE]MBK2036154.1 primosomal protein N' [Francisella tularensis subsp. novicida]MBK2116080.1 primosomal protein N' [Francisella tularensis subsp. novicida]